MRQPKYRLSPNEVERLVKEDQERRRKLRLIQVREQSKASAALIRADVRKEKERLLSAFAENVKEQIDAEKEEKTRTLKQKYENTLRTIGESHRAALRCADGENVAEKHLRQMQQETLAQQRFKQALDRQRQEEAEKDNQRTKNIMARLAALDKEKLRAAEVANLPPPPPDITVSLDAAERRRVPLTDMKAFATTRYHIPDYHVVKANAEEQELYDAKSQAEDVDLKLKQDLEEKKRSGHEMLARARIRGNEALKKEMLKHEYADFLKDLSLLQKQDRRLRQKKLSEIPNQVFLPPEQCLAERQDRQKELESRFDEMFATKSADEEAIPQNSAKPVWNCEEQQASTDTTSHANPPELSIPMSKINPALRDLTNLPQPSKEPEFQKPETVLKQLMNRIKEQRGGLVASQPFLPLAASAPAAEAGVKISLAETSQPRVVKQASWETAEKDQETIQRHPHENLAGVDSGRIQKSAQAGEMIDSDLMIQDLKQRIDVIELQKRELTLMLQGQQKSQLGTDSIRQQQPPNRAVYTPGQVYVGQGVDARDGGKWPNAANSNDVAGIGNCAEVATQLPVTNRYGNGQDLLWNPCHSPADDVSVPVGSKVGSNLARESNQTNSEYYRNNLIKGSLVESNLIGVNQHLYPPMANFDRFTLPSLGYASMEIGSGNINNEQGMWTDKGEDPVGSLLRGDKLLRKVREYTERAVDRQAGLDANMIQKVRQYQQKLLQTHEDRKQYLADIRADIESRRQELKSTNHTRQQPLVSVNTSEHWELSLKGIQSNMHQKDQSLLSGLEAPHAQAANDIVSNVERRPTQTLLSDLSKYNQIFADLQTNKSDSENAEVKGPAVHVVGPAAENSIVNVSAGVKPKIDRVRKSLSFDGAEEGVETGNISWKDFLSESNQNSSPGLSEYSLPISGGEESGSPLLAARSRKWLEDLMVHKSGINGSDLLAVAEEQQLGFEDRHRELQQQLKDIEQQKEAIMQTYAAGQQALKERQAAMKTKLVAASVLSNQDWSASKGSVKTAERKMFEDVKVVPNKAASTLINEGRNVNMKLYSVMENTPTCGLNPLGIEGTNSSLLLGINESRTADINVSWPDRTSGAALDNLSSNSFLAEISFHNIRTSNDTSRHTSTFQAVQPAYSYSNSMASVAKFPECVPALAENVPRYQEPVPRPVNSQPLHSTRTWASILLSEGHIYPPSIDFQTIGQTQSSLLEPGFKQSNQTALSKPLVALSSCDPSSVNKTLQTTKPADDIKPPSLTKVTLKEMNPSQTILESSLSALPSVLFQTSGVSDPLGWTQSYFTHEDSYHRPHELSTILEVETPGPSSTITSSKIMDSSGLSLSSHTLNHAQGQDNLSAITSVNPSSGIQVDLFKDLPFTFHESRAASFGSSGAVYNLATVFGNKSSDSKTPSADRILSLPFDGKKTASAKRSLNFAEDLFETPMPNLVELTPCKSPNAGKDDSSLSRFVELKPANLFYSPRETSIICQADTGTDTLDIGNSGVNTQKPVQIGTLENSDILTLASRGSNGDIGNCQKMSVKTNVGSAEEADAPSHSARVEGVECAQVEATDLSDLANTSGQMSIASLGLTSTCALSDDLEQISMSETAAEENSEQE